MKSEENAYSFELDNLVLQQMRAREAHPGSKKKRRLKRYLGITLALLSALFLSLANIFTRLARLFSGSEIGLIGYSITLITMLVFICASQQQLREQPAVSRKNALLGPREHRKIIIMRSCAIIVGVVSIAHAVKLISPGDATAIFETNVIVVALLASVVFNEVLSFIHIFCLFIAISGVFFISQPPFLMSLLSSNVKYSNVSNQTMSLSPNATLGTTTTKSINYYKSTLGLALSILAAFSVGFSTILLKKLTNLNVHFSIMLVYQGYMGVPTCLVLSILNRYVTIVEVDGDGDALKNHSLSLVERLKNNEDGDASRLTVQCLYAVLAALSLLFAQLFLNIGLRYEDPAKFSIVRMTDLLFTFILQMLILDIYANYLSIIGALLIFLSTFMIIFYSHFL